jgi:hypothetical protein
MDTWILSHKYVGSPQVGSDEEEAGGKSGRVHREARQLHKSDDLWTIYAGAMNILVTYNCEY